MPTSPPSPDPSSASADSANPFAGLGAGMGFFQDWMKAAGSALPHLTGQSSSGTSGAPAWTLPTLDPDELDKRIQDLKTVQFWLEQNARLIGMTIQGLEVQRMTLSTLKGMNVSMDAVRDALKARAASTTPAPTPAPSAEPPIAAEPTPPPAAASATHGADAAAELVNPIRWWDTLTQQFTHLATQAAASVPLSPGQPAAQASKKPVSRAAKKAAPARKQAKAPARKPPRGDHQAD